jgi:nitrogen fixation/metabolism regulation signal transduction histidine kinase
MAPSVEAARPMTRERRGARRLSHESRVTLLALLGGAPALVTALVLIWSRPHPMRVRLTLTLLLVIAWAGAALALRERVVRPLQTLSNLLAALREGDYSIRARGADTGSPLALALHEVNALTDALRRQRLDALEATGLLRRVMEEIEVAIFAFDEQEGRLRLLNRRAEELLGLPAERALGADAGTLGLAAALGGETPRLLELALPGRAGRWQLRRGRYRWEGRPHLLVVLSDLTRSLREEEQLAWRRLVRVLSHEINNSLAPIQSIAGTLQARLARGGPDSARELAEGLAVIESRADTLGRFIHAYARLARLPRPRPQPLDVPSWVRRAASLETRLGVEVAGGPEATLHADPEQMEALLTNLVRNAADATHDTGGRVVVGWRIHDGWLALEVEDEGQGLGDTSNLFVPFFTTKPGGSGIGLTLCRQIADAHGGSVTLADRERGRGCVATVRLPLQGPLAEGA